MTAQSARNTDSLVGLAVQWNGVASGKRPIVLIHGAGGRAADWPFEWREPASATAMLGVVQRTPDRWIEDRAVYAIDLPGHGRSEGRGQTSVPGYADTIAGLLDEAGLNAPILAGHSMGGAIVLEVARRQNGRLGGIVIMGSAALLPVSPAILEGLRQNFDATIGMIVKYCWHRNASDFHRTISLRRMRETGQEVVYRDFIACSQFNAAGSLHEITCAALVIAGDSDRMIPPESSEALARALPHSVFHTIENAGHFFHVERTAQVTPLIRAFCNQLDD